MSIIIYQDAKHKIQREFQRKWYLDHKEQINARIVRWRLANPEKVKSRKVQYHIKHKEQINARSAKWQKENPEKCKVNYLKWHKSHPIEDQVSNNNGNYIDDYIKILQA